MLLSLGSVGVHRALAIPVILTPGSSSPTPIGNPPNELAFNSPVLFAIEDPISSTQSRANQRVRLRLEAPLVVNGHTIASAGTPGVLRILDARAAESGDTYGYVDVYFEPLTLIDHQRLPLRAPQSRLQIIPSSGHQSTVGVEDALENAIIPYHLLYQIFRKGRNFELKPGAIVRARTQAAVILSPSGVVTLATPQPLPIAVGTPFASFPVEPMATPASRKERPQLPPPIFSPPPTGGFGTPPPMGPGGPGGVPTPSSTY